MQRNFKSTYFFKYFKTKHCSVINTSEGEAIFGSEYTEKEHAITHRQERVDGIYTTDCRFTSTDGQNTISVIARLGENPDSMKAEFELERKQLEDPGMSGEGRKPETTNDIGDQAHWTSAKGLVPGSLGVLKGKNILYVTVDGFGQDNTLMLGKAKALAEKTFAKL